MLHAVSPGYLGPKHPNDGDEGIGGNESSEGNEGWFPGYLGPNHPNDGDEGNEGNEGGEKLDAYFNEFKASWLWDELYRSRNFGPAIHKFGTLLGGAFNFIDQNFFGGKLPFTLHDLTPDHATLKPAAESKKIEYAKPDGTLSFDKLSSVFLSSTNH